MQLNPIMEISPIELEKISQIIASKQNYFNHLNGFSSYIAPIFMLLVFALAIFLFLFVERGKFPSWIRVQSKINFLTMSYLLMALLTVSWFGGCNDPGSNSDDPHRDEAYKIGFEDGLREPKGIMRAVVSKLIKKRR